MLMDNYTTKDNTTFADNARFTKEQNQFIIHTRGASCSTMEEILSSEMFDEVVKRYINILQENDSPILDKMPVELLDPDEVADFIRLLKALADNPLDKIIKTVPGLSVYADCREDLNQMVEGLYDFWRSFSRFMVCHSSKEQVARGQQFYRKFNTTMEQFTSHIRTLYRSMSENITGEHPRVYRQICAGCEVGFIAVKHDWECPDAYKDILQDISFIRHVLINPPFLINPPMNKRTGQFRKIGDNPLAGLKLDKTKWLCYPAQVGPLVIYIFFHQKYIGLCSALCNLFDLANDEQMMNKPDAVYVFGAPAEPMSIYGQLPTVFYDDEENDLLVAAVPNEDRFGYFGYVKKMVLTLHNIVMMKRERMPFHGAMVRIELKDGSGGNVLLIGDTAAGKSESLEAFRRLGKEHIRELRIIADDMGSLEISPDGKILGYGTEIGAFIRLDDLEYGYAFGQIDRAIIMSPHMVNARVVLPVTTMDEVLKGYPIDIMLYANNYDEVDEHHPIVEPILSPEVALAVFREGAAMAKGTTTSTGLTHSYFANIFGPTQYREMHEELAKETFEAAYTSGVFVGQLRTRLGINGYETKGPDAAALALFNLIKECFDNSLNNATSANIPA
jgi:hypothetical protein